MLVLAQLSTSVSDDQIRLIVIALLVVAVLLALLTIWYFVKTSPSRRVRAAQVRRQAAAGRTGAAGAAGAAPGQAGRSAPADAATGGPSQGLRADEILDDVDGGDEWDRLTAPERRRPSNT